MPRAGRSKADKEADYQRGVFINCPFDVAYRPMFNAMVFAVTSCGLEPRSALEIDDASQTRIDKIAQLIGDCRWGIHDISRVELNEHGLPRFNMPLELGLFLGAKRFGDARQRRKSCMVLDTDPFRFQRYISDIAGQDITPHGGQIGRVISAIRGWLASSLPTGGTTIPGGSAISRDFDLFQGDLPAMCQAVRIELIELTFVDYARFVSTWLRDTHRVGATPLP